VRSKRQIQKKKALFLRTRKIWSCQKNKERLGRKGQWQDSHRTKRAQSTAKVELLTYMYAFTKDNAAYILFSLEFNEQTWWCHFSFVLTHSWEPCQAKHAA